VTGKVPRVGIFERFESDLVVVVVVVMELDFTFTLGLTSANEISNGAVRGC
jgi:hypothetical protein